MRKEEDTTHYRMLILLLLFDVDDVSDAVACAPEAVADFLRTFRAGIVELQKVAAPAFEICNHHFETLFYGERC